MGDSPYACFSRRPPFSPFQAARFRMSLRVFTFVVCLFLSLALLWRLDWLHFRSSSSRVLLSAMVDNSLSPCEGGIGYLDHPFEKEDPWAFTARIFLVVKWGLAIEMAGEEFSYTRETTRVWAAHHEDRPAKVAGEACHRSLQP